MKIELQSKGKIELEISIRETQKISHYSVIFSLKDETEFLLQILINFPSHLFFYLYSPTSLTVVPP